MGYTIDIDTGGTFTDGFFARAEGFRAIKTPTTPHDLTACFLNCIRAGADAFGVTTEALLAETEVVRFCNTVGTNAIIERTGAKIGLILSRGSEGLAPTAGIDGRPSLVLPDMVATLALPPSSEAVLNAAQDLIDRGAQCLVIAFAGSNDDPAQERAARAVVKAEYPRDYLGSVPVFLASDVTPRSGEQERINTAVLNAYIHGKLTRLLYKAGEDLRRTGFAGQLLIGHNNGAAARVAKTRAINTYNSGPAAGLLGAREIGALYGADVVMSADMGGTSFDIGWVRGAEPNYALRPDVEGFRCNLPMMAILALGAGGGSIAAVVDGRLTVGPRSAGALPGPACFALGGTEPTVTDANVVLGFLDPHFFLGGQKKLDRERAAATISSVVADPLGISVEEAAWRIKQFVDRQVGEEMAAVRAQAGGSDPLLVVFGGAGPLHACDMAARAGIRRIVVTPFSAVFSAYSSSLMDVGHLYQRRVVASLRPTGELQALGNAIAELQGWAERDMRGEGFASGDLRWSVEMIVESSRADRELRLTTTLGFERDEACVENLRRQAAKLLGTNQDDDIRITSVGLFVSAAVPHFRLRPVPQAKGKADQARKGAREVYDGDGRRRSLPVYDLARLGHGHVIAESCLVESEQTTVLVPSGWRLTVDLYNNLVIEGEY